MEALMCIKDCNDLHRGGGYHINVGDLFNNWSYSYNKKFIFITFAEYTQPIGFDGSNFMTVSEHRESLIDKILT